MEGYSQALIDTALRVGIPIAQEIECARKEYVTRLLYGEPLPEYHEDYDLTFCGGGAYDSDACEDAAPASEPTTTGSLSAIKRDPSMARIAPAPEVQRSVVSVAQAAPATRLTPPTTKTVETTTRTVPSTMTYSEALAYSSAKIGQLGEEEVFAILRERFSKIERTGHIPHSGDITLNCDYGKIIVEIKSYSTCVTQSQIAKFRRDLKDAGASAGLFISLRSTITGVRDNFAVCHEHTRKFVPVIYSSFPNRDMMKTSLVILYQLLGAVDYVNGMMEKEAASINRLAKLDETAGNLANTRRRALEITGTLNSAMGDLVGDLSTSETQLRSVVDGARMLPVDYDGGTVLTEIKSSQRYVSYTQDIRDYLIQFIRKVHARIPSVMEPTWTNISGRYLCKTTGHAFRLMAGAPEVSVPRTGVSDDAVLTLLNELNSDISISSEIVAKLTKKTAKNILDIV